MPQTTGMTYNIGETSTNTVGNTNDSSNNTSGFNPQPTKSIINNKKQTNTETKIDTSKVSSKVSSQVPTQASSNTPEDHPSMFNDYDDIVHKCKKDATLNSQKIQNTMPQKTFPSTTMAQTIQSFMDKYKTPMIIFIVVILLLIMGIVGYIFFYTKKQKE